MTQLSFVSGIIGKAGLRKFILTVYWIFINSILVFFGKIDGAVYKDISFWLVIGIFGANCYEHFSKTKNGNYNGNGNGATELSIPPLK